jgi:TRAP-type C4-dicarboxylate transport system permease small subunit
MVPPSPSPDLTSTRRWLRVVAEVVAVVVLATLAWWCWHRGVIVTMRRGVAMSRIEGGWWASATAAATLAGILLVDMVRR